MTVFLLHTFFVESHLKIALALRAGLTITQCTVVHIWTDFYLNATFGGSDLSCVTDIKQVIANFISDYSNDETSPSIIWAKMHLEGHHNSSSKS